MKNNQNRPDISHRINKSETFLERFGPGLTLLILAAVIAGLMGILLFRASRQLQEEGMDFRRNQENFIALAVTSAICLSPALLMAGMGVFRLVRPPQARYPVWMDGENPDFLEEWLSAEEQEQEDETGGRKRRLKDGKRGVLYRDKGRLARAQVNFRGSYAGFVSRAIAIFIDAIVLVLCSTLTSGFIAFTNPVLGLQNLITQLLAIIGMDDDATLVYTLAFGLFVFCYYVFFWSSLGKTVGMFILGIKVVAASGRPPGFWRAVMRMMGFTLSIMVVYLGFLWALVDSNRRGWHDLIAGTYVIYDWDAHPSEIFITDRLATVREEKQARRG